MSWIDRRAKPAVRARHRWLAAAAGLPLLVLGVTGALLVYPDVPNQVVGQPTRASGPGVRPAAELLAAAHAALPAGDRVDRVQYPPHPGGLAVMGTTGKRQVTVDPHTGGVLEVLDRSADARHWVLELHVSLFAGGAGTWVTGLASVGLLLLAVSGVYLWWPRGGWRRHYFAVAVRAGRPRLVYDLHRVGGLYAAVPLLLIAGTGAGMAFYRPVEWAVYALTSSPHPAKAPTAVPVPTDGRPPLGPDEVIARAKEFAPGDLYRLYPPTAADRPYRVFLTPAHDRDTRFEEVRLVLDPYTGAVLHEDGPRTQSAGGRAMRWLLPLHYGTFGGPVTQLLWLFASLAPVLLAGTGLLIWWRKAAKRRAAARFTPPPVPEGVS